MLREATPRRPAVTKRRSPSEEESARSTNREQALIEERMLTDLLRETLRIVPRRRADSSVGSPHPSRSRVHEPNPGDARNAGMRGAQLLDLLNICSRRAFQRARPPTATPLAVSPGGFVFTTSIVRWSWSKPPPRFAAGVTRGFRFLFANGFDVITYDYRGIGEFATAPLKGLARSWSDSGAPDFEAMLKRAEREFPGQPIDVSATVLVVARRDWVLRPISSDGSSPSARNSPTGETTHPTTLADSANDTC